MADVLEGRRTTVERVRTHWVKGGLQDVLLRRPQPERAAQRTMDEEWEAHLVTLACSQMEQGKTRWTMRLLADQPVSWQEVDHISQQTAWVTRKKEKRKP
jgi:hypothetical protein